MRIDLVRGSLFTSYKPTLEQLPPAQKLARQGLLVLQTRISKMNEPVDLELSDLTAVRSEMA